jgi:4-oxalocrotonate tautomerase
MPVVTIQSLEFNESQKEILAEQIANAISEVSSVPKDRIYIFFDGYPLNCAAVNGKLFSQNPPKFGKGAFST